MQTHVLVVDDDEFVRSLLARGLNHAGFLVTTADSAAEALPLLVDDAAAPVPVDVVLTDFSMPGLTGLDLVDVLKHADVELPCLLMSGDMSEALESEAHARGCVGCLGKPIRFAALVEHIHRALEVRAADLKQSVGTRAARDL